MPTTPSIPSYLAIPGPIFILVCPGSERLGSRPYPLVDGQEFLGYSGLSICSYQSTGIPLQIVLDSP